MTEPLSRKRKVREPFNILHRILCDKFDMRPLPFEKSGRWFGIVTSGAIWFGTVVNGSGATVYVLYSTLFNGRGPRAWLPAVQVTFTARANRRCSDRLYFEVNFRVPPHSRD